MDRSLAGLPAFRLRSGVRRAIAGRRLLFPAHPSGTVN
jgi:hypothetical protein